MPGLYDCNACRFGTKGLYQIQPATEDQRRKAHCGWLDETEWIGDKPDIRIPNIGCSGNIGAKALVDFTGVEWVGGVCPGWAVQQPAIAEIGEAFMALEAGALASMVPDISNPVAEGLLVLKRAVLEYDRVQNELRAEKAKTNG